MHEFEVRTARMSPVGRLWNKSSALRKIWTVPAPTSLEVIITPNDAPEVIGRMSNDWIAAAFVRYVVSEKNALAGNFGEVPFNSDAERYKFTKAVGEEIWAKRGQPTASRFTCARR